MALDLLLTHQMSYMSQNGFDVTMVSGDGPEIEKVIEREGCQHIIIPFTRSINPFKDLHCLILLIRLILRQKPDIVHTHTPKAGLIGMLASKITGVTFRFHTIAGLPLMTAKGLKKLMLLMTERLTYWGATVVLPNSKSIRTYMVDQGLVNPSKLQMISKGSSNGIDLGRFSESVLDRNKLEMIRSEIGKSTDRIYLLAVGRVVRDKGVEDLVSAFQNVRKEHPELNLVIVGAIEKIRKEEDLSRETLEAITNDPFINHVGWSDEVEYYMAACDLFIHASYREGFPNVVLQAGAMKCPIICSDIPGNIDIVTDRSTGIHFEVGQASDLEDKIKFALNHRNLMTQYASKLRTEIESYYERSMMHQAILNFYNNQLESQQ